MRLLRLDDLGACSKRYEYWSRHRWANVWPLHSRYLFGAWAPYRELTAAELDTIFGIVAGVAGHLTVAITAAWVEADGTLTPYWIKYAEQAAVVRRWADQGPVAIAMHGRTHCVPGAHRPRWIGGNRRWHREPFDMAATLEARAAMEAYFHHPITRYVAPGTIAAPEDPEIVFHDREFVLDWPRAMHRLRRALA